MNRILEYMKLRGFKNRLQLSLSAKMSSTRMGEYVHEKKTGLPSCGGWRPDVLRLCEVLSCEPEDLFPEEQEEFNRRMMNNVELLSLARRLSIGQEDKEDINDINEIISYGIRRDDLIWALSKLKDRSRKVIELRYGETIRTYEDIGRIMKLTSERIRQIEKIARRKLRIFLEHRQSFYEIY
jgi:RNA polymerase sigma factor (sigma-70 family)